VDSIQNIRERKRTGRAALDSLRGDLHKPHIGASRLFPIALDRYTPIIELRKRQPEHFLPDPKVLSTDLQFEIANGQGTLRVSLKHGIRASDKIEVMQMDLSAVSSAKPDGSNLPDWLETAHEWIVRGFTDLTTEEAHGKWKRVQ
jgi:uncharacterized protein (TIGR04255 family)